MYWLIFFSLIFKLIFKKILLNSPFIFRAASSPFYGLTIICHRVPKYLFKHSGARVRVFLQEISI